MDNMSAIWQLKFETMNLHRHNLLGDNCPSYCASTVSKHNSYWCILMLDIKQRQTWEVQTTNNYTLIEDTVNTLQS